MEIANGVPRVIFQGRIMTVRADPVLAKSGPGTREVVDRPPAAAVVAQTADGRVVVIRQFRWAVQRTLVELPAGLIDPGETPLAAAQRELREETGYLADHWQLAFDCYTSPGFSTERIHVFYASRLSAGDTHTDPDEEIAVECWDRARIENCLKNPSEANGILVSGLLWWLANYG